MSDNLRFRCMSCGMPTSGGSLWGTPQGLKCGTCLRAEVADLRCRIRLARRECSGWPFQLQGHSDDQALAFSRDRARELLDLRRPLPSRRTERVPAKRGRGK